MTRPAAAVAQRPTVLSRLQLGIETLYRVETYLEVDSFLIDENARRQAGVARLPREQLLVSQGGESDELQIGLYLDGAIVSNLERHDPALGLHADNFADFCLAVEGISHFIYVAVCAAGDRSVSALELELQAEVDKFACCLLVAGGSRHGYGGARRATAWGRAASGGTAVRDGREVRDLTTRLYDEVRFADDLDADERDRYRVANLAARQYARTLSRAFVERDRLSEMLFELRRFYRLGLDEKLSHIARSA